MFDLQVKRQTTQSQNIWNSEHLKSERDPVWFTHKRSLAMSFVPINAFPSWLQYKKYLCVFLVEQTHSRVIWNQTNPSPSARGNFPSADIMNCFFFPMQVQFLILTLVLLMRTLPVSFTFSPGLPFSVKHGLKVVFNYVCSLHLYFSLPSPPTPDVGGLWWSQRQTCLYVFGPLGPNDLFEPRGSSKNKYRRPLFYSCWCPFCPCSVSHFWINIPL